MTQDNRPDKNAACGTDLFSCHAAAWADPGPDRFDTPETYAGYTRRARRILDVLALNEPDQVPVYFMADGYIPTHSGLTPKTVFYDPDRFIKAMFRLHQDFGLDYAMLCFVQSGHALDTLGMRLIRWPGSRVKGAALPEDMPFQYVEDQYMRMDEYDELISNPEGYMIRRYLPRIFSRLDGMADLPNTFSLVETTGFAGTMLGLAKGAPARTALDRLLKAADQAQADIALYLAAYRKIEQVFGAPKLFGGVTKTPYDIIGDTMRCTVGIVTDIYSRPEKVLAAVKALVPMAVQTGVQTAAAMNSPFIIIPLHKGSDDFMSPEQFKTFYWPTLKATLQGIIEQGFVPVPFVEGTYTQRLDIMADDPLPPGRSMWIFDKTDMKAAKEKIGPWACIAGNVPGSLFKQGSVQMLEQYCKTLIETCAPGGGFCLFPGTVIDRANPANIRAYLNCGQKFGRY